MAMRNRSMNLSKTMMQARRWHGLTLGILVVAMMHFNPTTNAARDNGTGDASWPALLSGEASADPSVVMLHRRAIGTLEKLTSADAAEPL
jgi:hypothetical protein